MGSLIQVYLSLALLPFRLLLSVIPLPVLLLACLANPVSFGRVIKAKCGQCGSSQVGGPFGGL